MKSLLATLALAIALLCPTLGSARPADSEPPAAAIASATEATAVSTAAVATTASPAAPAAPAAAATSNPASPATTGPAITGPATSGDAAKTSTAGAVVCRTVRVTGSRLRKERVCSTQSSSQDAQDWLKRQQENGANRGSSSDVNGGG